MAERAGLQLSLAEWYQHFGTVDAGDSSPLYERVATAIAESPEALAVVRDAPEAKRHPTIILAALHDQALQGYAPELADAYARRDLGAAGPAAVAALVNRASAVIATATGRQTQTNETGRGAVLYPAVAEAAARVGATAVGLVDVGCSAGLNLSVDRACIRYDGGPVLGDSASPLQIESEWRGGKPVPRTAMPEVAARVGIDLAPVDVGNPDDLRWLRACLWPDQPERIARLDAAVALSALDPPLLLAGDALEVLPEAVERVPAHALVVITTTWALAYFSTADRLRFLRRVDEIAARRPVAWISAEGVGIAPGVPTMGDSRRAAHSVVGIAIGDGRRMEIEAVARCHPHGRWVEWLG